MKKSAGFEIPPERRYLSRYMADTRKNRKPRLTRKRVIYLLIAATFHVAGFILSLSALDRTRTPQGTIAWVATLNTIPYVAVPAYWFFGKSEFQGYVTARRSTHAEVEPTLARLREYLAEQETLIAPSTPRTELLERLTELPVTTGNNASLLLDGDATFKSIFDGMRSAEDYIIVQFYIIVADEIGNELKSILVERAQAGVRCYVLCDGIGTDLPDDYLRELAEAGVELRYFATVNGLGKDFQVNFRNHRKTVIVDGHDAWVGGLNVANDYKDGVKGLGPWRDTHIKVSGPVVKSIQLTFLEDWLWVSGEILQDLNWRPVPIPGNGAYIIASVPSGPADRVEAYTLLTLDLIHSAQERLWIATPYFVPDPEFIHAIQLAALRGVDVKILIPEKPDNAIARLASLSVWNHVAPLEVVGAEMHQYTAGFMHQKVLLADDICTIGTANFDPRSFRLNFELTLTVLDAGFSEKVAAMLEEDFSKTNLMRSEQLEKKGYWYNIAVRAARLASPVL